MAESAEVQGQDCVIVTAVTSPSPVRGRFAPSPTGPLHWGSLLAAVGSWLFARQAGGEWWVRIEDLDPPREQPGAADRQLKQLARLGLHSDGPIVKQSSRYELYRDALERLRADGTAFACRCSRADLEPFGGIHRHCVANPAEGAGLRTRSFRFRVPPGRWEFEDAVIGPYAQDLRETVGDVVLRRADGLWAYQLAVVVDDGEQGITQVVRGADLLDSTPRQLALQAALGLARPGYAHLPLVLGADGRKLSKSDGVPPPDDVSAHDALRRCWQWLGQPLDGWIDADTAEAALSHAATVFTPSRVPRCAVLASAP